MKEGKVYPTVKEFIRPLVNDRREDDSPTSTLKGMMTITWFLSSFALISIMQMDLIRKNRMKEVELLREDRNVYLMSSVYYFYIEYLLFLMAFLQTYKCHKYLSDVQKVKDGHR